MLGILEKSPQGNDDTVRSEGRFLLARERSVRGTGAFQMERMVWTKVLCQKEACPIEGLKSDQCHWNAEVMRSV